MDIRQLLQSQAMSQLLADLTTAGQNAYTRAAGLPNDNAGAASRNMVAAQPMSMANHTQDLQAGEQAQAARALRMMADQNALSQTQNLQDPNSQISQTTQTLLGQLGVGGQGVSADNVQNLVPLISGLVQDRYRREDLSRKEASDAADLEFREKQLASLDAYRDSKTKRGGKGGSALGSKGAKAGAAGAVEYDPDSLWLDDSEKSLLDKAKAAGDMQTVKALITSGASRKANQKMQTGKDKAGMDSMMLNIDGLLSTKRNKEGHLVGLGGSLGDRFSASRGAYDGKDGIMGGIAEIAGAVTDYSANPDEQANRQKFDSVVSTLRSKEFGASLTSGEAKAMLAKLQSQNLFTNPKGRVNFLENVRKALQIEKAARLINPFSATVWVEHNGERVKIPKSSLNDAVQDGATVVED